MSGSSCAPKQNPPLQQALDDLGGRLDVLHDAIKELDTRLGPVRVPVPAGRVPVPAESVTAPSAAEPIGSPVADDLRRCTRQVDTLYKGVTDILQTIDL